MKKECNVSSVYIAPDAPDAEVVVLMADSGSLLVRVRYGLSRDGSAPRSTVQSEAIPLSLRETFNWTSTRVRASICKTLPFAGRAFKYADALF